MSFSCEESGPERLEAAAFRPEAVPATTSVITEQLRRDAANTPPLTEAMILQRRSAPPDPTGPLAVAPRSELATERTIAGPRGPVRLRLFCPTVVRACYLHVHGGGWALGGPDRQDQTLLRFATAAHVAVAAVDYRLDPHPAGLDDCLAAIRWLAANGGATFGASRLLVGGESAGAHLAALALLTLRDDGELGSVAAANLAYGVYDVSMTPSARRWGDERIVINTPDLAFFANRYAPAARQRDPDVSPLYADLAGLPPALFSCGTLDPLLDDTLFMAARWRAAGRSMALAIYPGAPHEFLNLRPELPVAAEARAHMCRFIDRVLSCA